MISTTISAAVPLNYELLHPESSGPVYVLLHGYLSTAEHFYKEIKSALPENASVLLVNAPYLVPWKGRDGQLRVGCSWYFYQSENKTYVVDQRFSSELLCGLVAQVVPGRELIVIGYSQGGYQAPFFAQSCPQVREVIGLACEFLPRLNEQPINFKMSLIYGEKDKVVNPEHISKNFSHFTGNLVALKDEGHKITKAYLQELQKIIGR